MGLFSSIGSFLLGGRRKSSSQTATSSATSDIDPYSPVIPYINDYLGQTANLYGGGAPQFSPTELQGYERLQSTANGPSAVDPAIAENNKTLSGAYLTPDTNPYLKDIATRISGIAGANSNATFGGRGRSGGGLAGYYGGKAVGDSLTDLYGGAYEAERGRMGQAVGQAPGLDQARYNPAQALISAGQNISARPYDINQQQGGILSQIGRLGQQGATTGNTMQQNYTNSNGLVGSIFNSFTNKLFGTTLGTN